MRQNNERVGGFLILLLSAGLLVAACTDNSTDDPADRDTDLAADTGTDLAADPDTDLAEATDADSAGNSDAGPSDDTDTAPREDPHIDPSDEPTCAGYATRYWDCCKAHCGWADNVPDGISPVTSCDASNEPLDSTEVQSSCVAMDDGAAFTCTSMAPWAVSDTLSYGFAAVPATGDICGRCYELTFDGTSFNAGDDPGSAALADKRMIVQATNIGYDVGNGQFDLLIPGGGVGLFDACTYQWGVETGALGATYGGLLAACKEDLGGGTAHDGITACVETRCDELFQAPELSELREGCRWFAGWFEAADNPALQYREVTCPQALVDASGVDRRSLDDVARCDVNGGAECSQDDLDNCDCGWAEGGANCGDDDGSCCWTACCGDA